MGDPNFADVSLLMHCDDFSDVVTAGDATNESSIATVDTGTVKFGSGSILTGAGALTFPSSNLCCEFGTSPFTIEFWFNVPSTGGTKALLAKYEALANATPYFWLYMVGNLYLKFTFKDASFATHNSNTTSGVTFSAGTWYAVCLERDGSGDLRIYIDGVMRSKSTGWNYDFSGFTNNFVIGSLRPDTTGNDANAYFDEIRITNGVARYASDSGYTVQTAAFPDSVNDVFSVSVDETGTAADGASSGQLFLDTISATADGADGASALMPFTDTLSDSAFVYVAPVEAVIARAASISEAATVAGVMTPTLGTAISDYAELAESMGVTARYTSVLAEAAQAVEALRVGVPLTVAEAASLSWAMLVVQGAAIAERIGASEVLNFPVIFKMSVAEQARVHDALARFFNISISETLSMQETMAGLARHFASVSDAGSAAAIMSPHFILKAEAHDDGVFDDAFDLKMIFRPEIHEFVEFSVALAMPDGGITTWAINTRTGAVTEYENYAFNSFCRNENRYLGAASDGLYILDGDDDAGTPTISRLRSGYAQFGGSRFTGFAGAYLGMRGNGDIYLKLDAADGKTYTYKALLQDQQTTKVRFGKGLRARYFAFELITEGQDFDLDTIEFVPLVAQRRV